MNAIVVYYSGKGSNKFLAGKISESLSCDLEKIRPWLNIFLLFLMGIHLGIRPLKRKIKDYDTVILCGPIWMGKLIPPLRSFLMKYRDRIGNLVFVTCCGSPDEKKDEKFGHGIVFREVEKIVGSGCVMCRAFPIILAVPDEKKSDGREVINTRLTAANFKGEIRERFNNFIMEVKRTGN